MSGVLQGSKAVGHYTTRLHEINIERFFFSVAVYGVGPDNARNSAIASDGCQPKSVSKGFVSSTEEKKTLERLPESFFLL